MTTKTARPALDPELQGRGLLPGVAGRPPTQ